MPEFVPKVGHLVLMEVVSGKKAKYRCTFEGCGSVIVRALSSIHDAAVHKREAACKRCGRVIKNRRHGAHRAVWADHAEKRGGS